jgi:hypothetical protein
MAFKKKFPVASVTTDLNFDESGMVSNSTDAPFKPVLETVSATSMTRPLMDPEPCAKSCAEKFSTTAMKKNPT